MGDYTKAAQMFLKFAGPLSPSGRAMTFLSNVGDLENSSMPSSGSAPPNTPTITPTVRAMNEMEQAMAKQEMRQRKTVAKGGRVSYKSVFDMER